MPPITRILGQKPYQAIDPHSHDGESELRSLRDDIYLILRGGELTSNGLIYKDQQLEIVELGKPPLITISVSAFVKGVWREVFCFSPAVHSQAGYVNARVYRCNNGGWVNHVFALAQQIDEKLRNKQSDNFQPLDE